MPLTMHPFLLSHPGEWLRTELVAPAGLSTTALAEHLGVSRQAASALLNGRAGLSAEMAIRFEKLFGVSADTLVRMQTAFDLARARATEDRIKVRPVDLAA